MARAKTKSEMPFASIPLLFGIQQAIEGVVWISFGSTLLNSIATYAYSFFSHVLWPIFTPFSILLLEKDPFRKKILRMFFALGLGVGLYLLYFIIIDPITANIVNKSIAYRQSHLYPPFIIILYLIATCGSCLVSSNKFINLFGVVLLMSFIVAVWFFTETLLSVWCFFAAVPSALIFWYFKRKSVAGMRDK